MMSAKSTYYIVKQFYLYLCTWRKPPRLVWIRFYTVGYDYDRWQVQKASIRCILTVNPLPSWGHSNPRLLLADISVSSWFSSSNGGWNLDQRKYFLHLWESRPALLRVEKCYPALNPFIMHEQRILTVAIVKLQRDTQGPNWRITENWTVGGSKRVYVHQALVEDGDAKELSYRVSTTIFALHPIPEYQGPI